ncbi:EKC/KEOPS complex subunit [Cladobotryum mycophilum]|uniref:EKC/KEOPS complex subunit CGI121 n=1 Tax=Cladobotryum mycophilum TaxID=491253 RepID=A0ABR0S4E5_9HYPO
MYLKTVELEHIPSSYVIHLALFHDVQNSAFLHQQLLARNAEFEYAFIDASVIVSRAQLLSAVFKAITSSAGESLKTPNVHSETVVSLSPSSNIADAYRRFGISPTTNSLLVLKITLSPTPGSAEQISKHLEQHVEGKAVPASDENIAKTTDFQAVRKNYKLNGLPWLDVIRDDAARRAEIEKLVISGMALRGL